MTKTNFFKAISDMLVLITFAFCYGQLFKAYEIKAASGESAAIRSIDVTGTGSIKAKPDIAVLNVGVTTKGATASIQEENKKMMNSVMASIKAFDIDEKDIKTIQYYMNPKYD